MVIACPADLFADIRPPVALGSIANLMLGSPCRRLFKLETNHAAFVVPIVTGWQKNCAFTAIGDPSSHAMP